MKYKPLRTILIGFGKVAAGYAADTLFEKYYPYATHAQVLKDHEAFEWLGVVDPSLTARQQASKNWQVPYVCASIEEALQKFDPEVVVIATPPHGRLAIIEQLPSLKAVLVEKPLGADLDQAKQFIEACRKKSILVQVNYWRRADQLFKRLAATLGTDLLHDLQAVFGVYGNGLLNNGSHMVDFVEMLCGNIHAVQAIPVAYHHSCGPIADDMNIAFNLVCKNVVANLQPLGFNHYRECGLDIWGQNGRLSIQQEGLKILHFPRLPNRSTQDAYEVASDVPQEFATTVGYAFYEMYTNLAQAIHDNIQLASSGENALRNMRILDAIQTSYRLQGALVEVN